MIKEKASIQRNVVIERKETDATSNDGEAIPRDERESGSSGT